MSVMSLDRQFRNWPKFILAWTISILLRLIPFRPANIEPILAMQMPFAKRFGFSTAFMFAFLNIVLYDVITNKVGVWTIITASAYGSLALFSVWYFKNRKSTAVHYVINAVIATIIYDTVTGLTIGPLFFGQSFIAALLGQIPFTLYHLIGNVSFALVLSPIVYTFLVSNPALEFFLIKKLEINKTSL